MERSPWSCPGHVVHVLRSRGGSRGVTDSLPVTMMTTTYAVLLTLCCGPFRLLGMVEQTAAADNYPCKARRTLLDRVTLCHNASMSAHLSNEECEEAAKGFVLTHLVLAPLKFYKDCDQNFHVSFLYDAQCAGEGSHQEEYDRIVFDILDKVSGQRRINSSSIVVDRFPLTVVKEGKELQDSSAFVVFKKLCKSAEPEGNGDVINLCSNQTVNGTFLYFSLRGLTPPPSTPSMCRCVLRPSSNLKLMALDVRLQDKSSRRCGKSALKIEANGTTTDIACHKMSALYGNHELYTNDSPQEVTLTLTYISSEHRPTSVWINAQDTYEGQKMSVSCGGFIPLPTKVPDDGGDSDDDDRGDDGGDDDGGNDGDEHPEISESDTTSIIIPVCVGGGILFLICVAVIIIIKRRRSGSYSGMLPSCSACCQCNEDDDDPIFYKHVAQEEPVYAEPGKPRPSTTTPPYTFPADAKLPEGRALYSEPDPNGTLHLHRGTSPPPVPEQPPPGSPPPFSPPGTPPPKPERTLLRKREPSTQSGPSEEEDYDHIVTGGKSPLKAPRGRDGQNNIIGDREDEEGERAQRNVYDCLRHGDDYSQIGENPKQVVKDNDYDTTA